MKIVTSFQDQHGKYSVFVAPFATVYCLNMVVATTGDVTTITVVFSY